MPSFKVPCPSCEAPVLIKNPNLVGTKVECPKCKYRFKVEEPAAAPAGADAKEPEKKPEADKKGAKADKKKSKSAGMSKKTKQILIGVAAIVGLGILAAIIFSGGGDKPKGPGGGGGPFTSNPNGSGDPDGSQDGKQDGKNPGDKEGPPPIPSSGKVTTNLLPGDSVAVYRINIERLRNSAPYEALVGQQLQTMFQNSLGFGIEDVDTYIHCFAGTGRDPFGVIKLRMPSRTEDTTSQLRQTNTLQPKPKPVKTYSLFEIRSNPFVNAVSHALSRGSVFGEFFEQVPTADAKSKPMGLCVYDNQHILLGDYALLERFLGSLDADGYPPFQTVMTTIPVAPPAPGMPPAPGTPPTAPPAPPPKAAPAPAEDKRAITSVDTYRTVKTELKRLLDEMELDRVNPPMFVYAEEFAVKPEFLRLMKKDYQGLSSVLEPVLAKTRYISANVMTFTHRQLFTNMRITFGSDGDARTLAKEQMIPALTRLAEMLKLYLAAPVEFRDYTLGGTTAPTTGLPMMGPMGLPTDDPDRERERPASPFTQPMPGIPMPGIPMPGIPLPGMQPLPGMPEFPGMPIPGMPDPKGPPQTISHIDLGMYGEQLLIALDLSWNETTYRTTIAPRVVSTANQFKGKMAIFSQEFSWHAVATAGPKAAEATKAFPSGTVPRRATADRFGLQYPPSQRVSLFVDLLPYLGRGQLKDSIRKELAWYDEKNMPEPGRDRAGAWVPELLVPYYPQSAWRAYSPLAPDHALGATNYVAIAGVGLDTPREDPNGPDFKLKKDRIGITGYGWGSKVEEVTDGLSNTIYMMQTPPGLQQPWIAGGGATVRGLSENDPMAGFRYVHPDGRGGTKQGTYALMGDGSVRWIPANIDPKVLKAMATRGGGDNGDLGDINKNAPKIEVPKPDPMTTELKAEPKPEPKKAEDKKTTDPKGTDPKVSDPKKSDPKATDPKAPSDKKEPGAKVAPAPAPKEK